MTLFRKAYKLFRQLLSIRIWLAGLVVILLILLLALTVNNAREKEMVDLFSRQQLASAQNAASRLTEIFSQVERSIILFSYLEADGKMLSKEEYREIDALSSVWGRTVDAVQVLTAKKK